MRLNDSLELHLRLTEKQKNILDRAGFKTIRDILWHFPSRYESFRTLKTIANLAAGDEATITGRVTKAKTKKAWHRRMTMAETTVSDGTGKLRVMWFNQPYMASMLLPEKTYDFSGRVSEGKAGLYMANPDYRENTGEGIFEEQDNAGTLAPVYPENRGLHSLWLRFAVRKLLKRADEKTFKDAVPESILKRYSLPSLRTAILAIHAPKNNRDAIAARKRFAFEEIFLIQLDRQKKRMARNNIKISAIEFTPEKLNEFRESLPFPLTSAQERAIGAILSDIGQPKPMSRLLEGDVGSGKTAVAAVAAYAVASNEKQIAYMAPTEVLARQHYREFTERFKKFGLPVALATSAEFRKFPSKAFPGQDTHIAKNQLLKWLASGEIPILIGTHALVQDKIKFKNLGLVIIDEQHRFGVNQRAKLAQKSVPHLLSMTATPIPRTLALTIYGDLDLTLLDEMPPGRKKVITTVVPPRQRERAYEQMRAEISRGRQAFVVCPRIEENSVAAKKMSLDMKSVKVEHKKLSANIFPEFEVGMLHGKMTPKEKEKVMSDFNENKIRILVATSVIEVGLNVPNATIIMIEGAERFGLAQLHQLRGRVLRSTHQPYCFLFTESMTQKTMSRLKALTEARNGFELAEYDLQFRGPGELSGSKQWGISDIGMEALKNIKMVEAARTEARALLEKDFELAGYPALKSLIPHFENLHFE